MKNLTIDYFDQIEFLPALLKYFALSPENKVTVQGLGPNVKITYYQTDEGFFHRCTDLGDGFEPIDSGYNMDLHELYAIISQLETLPATKEEYGFKNMKDQVRMMSTAYFDPRFSRGGWDRSR